MEKETIINFLKMIKIIFDDEIILTGSGSLKFQGFDCKVNDLDIIISNNTNNKNKINKLKKLFSYDKNPYEINNAFRFYIGDFKIEIFLKEECEIKRMELIDWSKEEPGIKFHYHTQIIKTKIEYGRKKDKDFFRKHKERVLQLLIADLSKKTDIRYCEIKDFIFNSY